MKKRHKLVVRRDCGFFSDFLTILAGIMYFIDNEIDYHIDWKNSLYPTVNPNDNLFDLFFNQTFLSFLSKNWAQSSLWFFLSTKLTTSFAAHTIRSSSTN